MSDSEFPFDAMQPCFVVVFNPKHDAAGRLYFDKTTSFGAMKSPDGKPHLILFSSQQVAEADLKSMGVSSALTYGIEDLHELHRLVSSCPHLSVTIAPPPEGSSFPSWDRTLLLQAIEEKWSNPGRA